MRNGDLAAEGRAGPKKTDHDQRREEESTVWENPSIQRELANLIITERVRRGARRRSLPRR